ncbi:MAG: flagellar filament capping protein FliD [Firmicutes bacterium]|jgi:flagellar hook-associated protein 2|nr:flagellar filament capping protein FliD [Bacillota bacterium]
MYISGGSSGNYMTGMASGMDVDTMVKELMDAERVSYDSYYQDIQYYEWQLDAYQSSADTIKSFQDDNFNYLNPDANLLSSSTYMEYNCSSSSSGVSCSVADNTVADDRYEVEVLQVASSASISSDNQVSKAITGSGTSDLNTISGEKITLDLDGNVRAILIEDNDGNGDIDYQDLQNSIDKAYGADKILVSDNSGILTINTIDGSGSHSLKIAGEEEVLEGLGLSKEDSLSNRINTSDTLGELSSTMNNPFVFDMDGMVTFEINGAEFEFDEDTSLQHMMDTINNDSDAGVTMIYDPIKDKFEITSDDTGLGSTLDISEIGSSFFSSIELNNIVSGEDSVSMINGEKVVRSTNAFEYDGVVFTTNGVTDGIAVIDINLDTEQIYDTVVNFVNDYNDMVESIQNELDEERDYDYKPLTQAQKDEMTEEEIEIWEDHAKSGVVGNDDLLENMLEEMRVALYTSVDGCEYTLSDIGITTDSYENGGKLIIDENKLNSAIEENPEEVVKLFTKQSDTYPGTSSARTLQSSEMDTRMEEEGLMYRLYDVTEIYVSTYSDSNGSKGVLVEKCGFSDDYTELNSSMYKHLEDMEDKLTEMEDELNQKETDYYMEFSRMETYISQMNSQMQMIQSWFA